MRTFLLISGSAGAGKSAVLGELARRHRDLVPIDLDELRPPPNADERWWHARIGEVVTRALELQTAGKDVAVAGWTSLDEVRAQPSARRLDHVVALLLDCRDDVRRARIGARAASGTWKTHTATEIEAFIAEGHRMRATASPEMRVVDTSELSVAQVADEIDALYQPPSVVE